MIRSYFKIAWRNILKNKLFSIINIVGLAIGLACSILILLWVQDEWSFDKFHKNGDNIYRVLQHMPFTEETTWAINQGPLDEALKNAVPEIIETTKINNLGIQFKYDNNEFRGSGLVATPSFLKIFSFPLVQGDENTVLKDIHSIILTEKMAKKVFAEEDPVGQSILVFDQYEFVVSGVIQDPPLNSHLTFIRKVFGAGTTTILYILSKGYIKLILISIGVAVPVSNYIIQDWLNKFAYKTDITVLTFLLPSLGLILASAIIVLGQSVKGKQGKCY